MHILLIDDSSSTRSLLRTLINSGQANRHEISEASSGEEALQKVESGEISLPDLIIVDINMAGMSGYDLCREFRARQVSASDIMPYIIVVTANEGVEVINEALDAGANDYMPKPVNVKILHVRLRVAERLLAQAQAGGAIASAAATGPLAFAHAAAGNGAGDPRQVLIANAVEQTDVPIALVEAGGDDDSFRVVYSNGAMTLTTQFEPEQLVGKPLAELEAWTPEFLSMVVGFTSRGATLSHVPLWSQTRQEFPVYLSFCPVVEGEEPVRHYLVIHHL
jgi:CheY-like chemotaxis protein